MTRMDGLNAAQQEAVRTLSGPLLVLAGAGTGKTRVVTYRVAELIRRGTRPSRILAVTFTNKAAAEMHERLGALLGRRLKERPRICTFHAHCADILDRHIVRLGYPAKYVIYDRGDQESVARRVLRELDLPGARLRPSDLLARISWWKAQGVRPAAAAAGARSDREHLAAAGYRRYQAALKAAGAVDFDDLLLGAEQLLDQFPDVLQEEAGRFDHILVDEYQDTCASQYRIVAALARPHRNLCVVGDDDQSIYAWRGADVAHILRFRQDWPEARIVRLEQNYRSTAAILELANRLIANNQRRYPKRLRAVRPGGPKPRILQFRDEAAEAKEIVADVRRRLRRPGCEPRDVAILFRTNEQPRLFETELRRAGLPYVLLGETSFYDRKEVRDVLAYVKLVVSVRDEGALRRVLNTPPRGLGPAAVERLEQVARRQACSLGEALLRPDGRRQLPAAAARGAESLARALQQAGGAARRRAPGGLAALVRRLLEQVDYRAEVERLYDEPAQRDARWRSVEEVLETLAAYERTAAQPSLVGFLREQALDSRSWDGDKQQQLRRNAVALMTLHSAKGLEFPYVYMVGMEEGLLPHRRSVQMDGAAIDEERRLCYVGVTRAQEELTLSLALTRVKWGKARPTRPSRFLYEMIGKPAPEPAGRPPARR